MLSVLSVLLGSLTGKLVLGTAVAAVSVGGAHAGGVIDVPGLPDRTPPAIEELQDQTDAQDQDEEAGAAQAPDSLTGPGVDGGAVSERAQELGEGEPGDGRKFGRQTREGAVSGTPASSTPAAAAGPATGQQASEAGAGNADGAGSGSPAPDESPSGNAAETGADAAAERQGRRP